ncbi:MAG: hypothetical protein QNJ43_07210 [Breoghania sp.]|nr:hypothetical protein [Breoghania sp.]
MEESREQALAKLSIAALAIDFLLVLAIWNLARGALPTGRGVFSLIATWFWLSIPLGLALHLLLCEVVLGWWSLGRFCCGLRVAHRNPVSSTVGWRMKRAFSILTKFGLGSLNPNRLPAYNCAEDLVFASDLVDQAPTRSKVRSHPLHSSSAKGRISGVHAAGGQRNGLSSKVQMIFGPHKGMAVDLAAGRSKDGLLKIGRDPAWADLVLSRDGKVSSRHCVLVSRGGGHPLPMATEEVPVRPTERSSISKG